MYYKGLNNSNVWVCDARYFTTIPIVYTNEPWGWKSKNRPGAGVHHETDISRVDMRMTLTRCWIIREFQTDAVLNTHGRLFHRLSAQTKTRVGYEQLRIWLSSVDIFHTVRFGLRTFFCPGIIFPLWNFFIPLACISVESACAII